MTRALIFEPQGEGGVCHYTYCLSQALACSGCEITLATGRPYELEFAQRRFDLEQVFGDGRARALTQRILRRAPAPAASRGDDSTSAPLPLTGISGRASSWLRDQEYEVGWRRTLALARRLRPDIAHVQWLSRPERDVRWLTRLRDLGIPVIFTAHNILPHDAATAARAVWRRVYGAMDAVIVHYPGAVDELRALDVAPERIVVIPHGNYLPIVELLGGSGAVDVSIGREARRRARERLGLGHNSPVALCFGLMRPYKGIEYLLDAFAGALRELPAARLLLAGRAPAGIDAFERRIHELGIAEAVITFPRYVPLADVGTWFDAADVVVAPYVEASQSGAVQLAFAFARPVIVTHVGGLPDAVAHGETGLIIPPRDSQSLARALIETLRDPDQCARWGAHGLAAAREHLSWGSIAQQTQVVYQLAQELVGVRQARGWRQLVSR
jgi:glycosyltransferase involved in cell wall biosynthesis